MSTKSSRLFEQAKKYLAGGISRNTLLRYPHPCYVESASGCRITDIEGKERIDFANNMAALIHGHAFQPITEAVTRQLSRGTAYTMATAVEVDFARHMCERTRHFDRIRFVNSGTEAIMAGLKAARAFTGRPRIAKVEGTYHGAYDYAEVSQAPGPENWGQADRPTSVALAQGTPASILTDVIVLPFNHPNAALAALDDHKDDLACILVDPMPHRSGLVPATNAFTSALREWSTANGALLMFDEVITYRTEMGGLQARHTATPDLTAMGKMIGGGFPVGAIAGREEVMGVFTTGEKGLRLPHSGTFSANPITMTAGLTAMQHFHADAVTRLNALGHATRNKINEAISIANVPASVTGAGSSFRIHMKAEKPTDYRSAFPTPKEKAIQEKFINALYDEGILIVSTGTGFLSTPMSETEIDALAEAVLKSLRIAWS